MIWFRKPSRCPSHDEIDERIASAEVDRDEAVKARSTSEARAERIRKRLEQNELGKGFEAAFRAWEREA